METAWKTLTVDPAEKAMTKRLMSASWNFDCHSIAIFIDASFILKLENYHADLFVVATIMLLVVLFHPLPFLFVLQVQLDPFLFAFGTIRHSSTLLPIDSGRHLITYAVDLAAPY